MNGQRDPNRAGVRVRPDETGPGATYPAGRGPENGYIDWARPGRLTWHVISPEHRAAFEATRAARERAGNDKHAAGDEILALGEKFRVNLSALKSGKPVVRNRAVRKLHKRGAAPEEIARAGELSYLYRRSDHDLALHGERLGMLAGEDVLRQGGYRQISGSSSRRGAPGRADLIGVSADRTSIQVIEAKGGHATLGTGRYLAEHDPPGRAEQGSVAYLLDLLGRDPEFQQALAADPELRQAYENRTLRIDYTLVSAHPDGTVTVQSLTSLQPDSNTPGGLGDGRPPAEPEPGPSHLDRRQVGRRGASTDAVVPASAEPSYRLLAAADRVGAAQRGGLVEDNGRPAERPRRRETRLPIPPMLPRRYGPHR